MSFISNEYHHEQTIFERIFVKWHNFGRRIMVHTCDKGTPFASVSTEWCMVLNLFFSIHAITKDEYTFVGWVNALDAIWQQKNSTKFSWLKNCKRIFGSQGISSFVQSSFHRDFKYLDFSVCVRLVSWLEFPPNTWVLSTDKYLEKYPSVRHKFGIKAYISCQKK